MGYGDMQLILLEKIRNFGNIGDKVNVRSGYGRNYLIPQGKAVPATAENIAKFEARRAELEKAAAAELAVAKTRVAALENLTIIVAAQVGEDGKLFGSVTVADIAEAIVKMGMEVKKHEVKLPEGPIRQVGEYDVTLQLHTDVDTVVKVIVKKEE